MRPSTRQLIESIVATIDDTILPTVTDKQAASSLRAARTLLEHLAVRVELEASVVAQDLGDALELFDKLGLAFPSGAPPEQMDAIRRLIDERLRAPVAPGKSGDDRSIRKALSAYLKRSRAREREMIFPAFLGTPF